MGKEKNKKIPKKQRSAKGKLTKVKKTTGIWMILFLFFLTGMIGIAGIGAVCQFTSKEMSQNYEEFDSQTAICARIVGDEIKEAGNTARGFAALLSADANEKLENEQWMDNLQAEGYQEVFYRDTNGKYYNVQGQQVLPEESPQIQVIEQYKETGLCFYQQEQAAKYYCIAPIEKETGTCWLALGKSLDFQDIMMVLSQNGRKYYQPYLVAGGEVVLAENIYNVVDYCTISEEDYYNKDTNYFTEYMSQMIRAESDQTSIPNPFSVFEDDEAEMEGPKRFVFDGEVPLDVRIDEENVQINEVSGQSEDIQVVSAQAGHSGIFRYDDEDESVNVSLEIMDKSVWYEKNIMDWNGTQLSLLIGREMAIDKDTMLTIMSAGVIYIVVMIMLAVILIFTLVSRIRMNRRLMRLAYEDADIHWYNLTKFYMLMKKRLKRNNRRREKRRNVLVEFKIQKFIMLMDTYGSEMVNHLLRSIAGVLKSEISKRELFCRSGESSFILLLEEKEGVDILHRLQYLDARLKGAVTIKGIEFKYGIYHIEDAKMPRERMLVYARHARELAAKNPNINMVIFDEEQHKKVLQERALEEGAQEALEKKEFKVYLQPKYKSDGSSVGGAEALVRWISEDKGFISPGAFIPLFEKNGFIAKLDEYMLKEVCAIQKKWMEEGKELITISVNISRVHLLEPHLVDKIVQIVDSYGIPRDCIELELTESAFFKDKDVLVSTVNSMREQGFKVSMDDFGSGYSSLNSLKDLSLDVVKMDGEFFQLTGEKERSSIIIEDAVKLVKDLNMEIVAEGIEHKEQVDFLDEIGCDLIQGYYFAKPMPVPEYEDLVYGEVSGQPEAE